MTNITFPNFNKIRISVSGIEIFPRNSTYDDETVLFDKITIDEDMFAESVFGSIEMYDTTPDASIQKSISFDGQVEIQIETKTYYFDISDINVVTDLASKRQVGSSYPLKIIIRFASKLFLYKNYDTNLLNDFIGKISSNGDVDERFLNTINLPKSGEPMEGFVQALYQEASRVYINGKPQDIRNTKPLIADNTFNDIWFRHDPSMYPWSKIGNTSRVSQLMNYVAEYACYNDNPNAVNFFFWEDLDNYNFRCLESLIEEQENDIQWNFEPTMDENNLNAIVQFEVINAISPIRLFENGAFIGEYVRTKPKWNDIYSDFLDTNGQLDKSLIRYRYIEERNNWKQIASRGYGVNVPDGGASNTVRTTDTNFGYYSTPYNSPENPWWNYYDNYNSYNGDVSLYNEPDRLSKRYWRSQFDFCELPGSWLKKIYRQIKSPLIYNRTVYGQKKRIKKQWEVFKNNVCCIKPVPETFFAVLTSAKKVYGSDGGLTATIEQGGSPVNILRDSTGIWKYTWSEVEFWPRDQADFVLSSGASKVIEFEDNSFPFVFVKPQGAAEGKTPPTNNPSLIPDTRAFNLNEILNSKIPNDFEFETYNTIMSNPGVSDAIGITGDKSSITSYPKNFTTMPVGKFRIMDTTCPPNFSDDGTTVNNDDSFYFGGRVVQMYRIPRKTLTGIQGITLPYDSFKYYDEFYTETKTVPMEDLYLFDVENAHDGLCINC